MIAFDFVSRLGRGGEPTRTQNRAPIREREETDVEDARCPQHTPKPPHSQRDYYEQRIHPSEAWLCLLKMNQAQFSFLYDCFCRHPVPSKWPLVKFPSLTGVRCSLQNLVGLLNVKLYETQDRAEETAADAVVAESILLVRQR